MSGHGAETKVFPDAAALARFAAELFAQAAHEAVGQRSLFLAALSGGSTPAGLYRLLALPPYLANLPWQSMHFFWGDERCVPSDDPGSNYRQAWELFLSRVAVPQANIHRALGEEQPALAAKTYARELLKFSAAGSGFPRFDLVLLGLGADGHIASLFPGSTEPAREAVVAAHAEYEGRPAERITLTPAVFNAARQVVFLVTGEDKAAAVRAALGERHDPLNIPAQRIRPGNGKVWWLLNEAAAKLIKASSQSI